MATKPDRQRIRDLAVKLIGGSTEAEEELRVLLASAADPGRWRGPSGRPANDFSHVVQRWAELSE
jgi:hypothetical protein